MSAASARGWYTAGAKLTSGLTDSFSSCSVQLQDKQGLKRLVLIVEAASFIFTDNFSEYHFSQVPISCEAAAQLAVEQEDDGGETSGEDPDG